MAGCHTQVLCLNGYIKPILKLFGQCGSPIIPDFSDPRADTQFQGEPLQLGRKIHGVGKFAIFDLNRRLSWKPCKIG